MDVLTPSLSKTSFSCFRLHSSHGSLRLLFDRTLCERQLVSKHLDISLGLFQSLFCSDFGVFGIKLPSTVGKGRQSWRGHRHAPANPTCKTLLITPLLKATFSPENT